MFNRQQQGERIADSLIKFSEKDNSAYLKSLVSEGDRDLLVIAKNHMQELMTTARVSIVESKLLLTNMLRLAQVATPATIDAIDKFIETNKGKEHPDLNVEIGLPEKLRNATQFVLNGYQTCEQYIAAATKAIAEIDNVLFDANLEQGIEKGIDQLSTNKMTQ